MNKLAILIIAIMLTILAAVVVSVPVILATSGESLGVVLTVSVIVAGTVYCFGLLGRDLVTEFRNGFTY